MSVGLRTKLDRALRARNVQAFLRVIREGESSQDDSAYRMVFGGGFIESMAYHPRKPITERLGGKAITSSAAGAYQFLSSTWDECAAELGLTDFGHDAQDLAAVYLIHRRGAFDDVVQGRIELAIKKCNREWASLPGSPYGQPVITLERALDTYKRWGGEIGSTATTPGQPAKTKEAPAMPFPAFLAAALPALIEIAPKLGRIFSSGSETAERNIQAVEMVVGIAKEAIGAKNEQELVETIKADPGAAQTVRDAIDANWGRIDEVGGGIQAARAADVAFAATGKNVLHSPAFIISCILLIFPLLLQIDLLFLHAESYDENLRTQITTAVLMVISIVGGFWLGSSFGSQRKDDLRKS